MFAALLVLALAAPPDARAAVAVAAASFNPAGSTGPVPVERWEFNPIHGYTGRYVGGVLVGGWFPKWNAYVDYDPDANRWGYSHNGPKPPQAAPVPVVVPAGHHAHRTLDGRTVIHGDWNVGDPAAHAGIPWPWPKTAFAGQTVICPGGR
jgi:hypothetical protein